jgi:hypothetical protein
MNDFISYTGIIIAFVCGSLTGIFCYRELLSSNLNNSSNKTPKPNKKSDDSNNM